jgi:hypothetical protein
VWTLRRPSDSKSGRVYPLGGKAGSRSPTGCMDEVRFERCPWSEGARSYSPEVPTAKSSAVVRRAVPMALVPPIGLTWLKTFQSSP